MFLRAKGASPDHVPRPESQMARPSTFTCNGGEMAVQQMQAATMWAAGMRMLLDTGVYKEQNSRDYHSSFAPDPLPARRADHQ
jgi:hypothetical protein